MIVKKTIREILSERSTQSIADEAQRVPAAVLLPLYVKGGQDYILFSKRTENLAYHKGQICFPGGACHKEDRSLVETALREAFEEIGVSPGDVEVLGQLDKVSTVTSNFVVSPFVGLIPYPYHFAVSTCEVTELIEVPIAALLENGCYYEEWHTHQGQRFLGHAYRYKDKIIWGATARILKQFLDLVFRENRDGR